MPWNGSGVFNRIYSWVADKAAGLDISSTRMDTDSNDIASSGFGNTLTRDGQGQPTANLPMNSFRHTGVGNGVARTDYAALNQAQDGLLGWGIASGSADAITAVFIPPNATLADGMLCGIRATAANATTTPTFAKDGGTAHTITRMGGAALVAGDIPGNLAESFLRYNLGNTRWELLNPAQPQANATISGTGELTIPNGTTGQRPGSPTVGIRFNSTTTAFEGWDGTAWRNLNAPAGAAPNVQAFTTGTSATYTTPAGALYLVIEMVGAGGGGGGSGASASNGGDGGATTFNSIVANGGAHGVAATTTSGQAGGAGGSGGSGAALVRIPGGAGNPGGNISSAIETTGGSGGVSFFGGAGTAGTTSINPIAGQAGSGSGGGGAGSVSTGMGGGGAGGAGEYAKFNISGTLSATYTYTVGAGGIAGAGNAGGASGATGASGGIIVTAYFQ